MTGPGPCNYEANFKTEVIEAGGVDFEGHKSIRNTRVLCEVCREILSSPVNVRTRLATGKSTTLLEQSKVVFSSRTSQGIRIGVVNAVDGQNV